MYNFFIKTLSKFVKIFLLFNNSFLSRVWDLYASLSTGIYFQKDLVIPLDEQRSTSSNKDINSFKDI